MSKVSARAHYLAHRAEVIARTNQHAKDHPEAHALYAKRWRERNPQKVLEKRLHEKYGLTTQARDALFDEQGRKCAACGALESGGKGWCVDHDHACCCGPKSCGKCIRGILCHACNVLLGFAKDSADHLRAAADYIEGWRAQHGGRASNAGSGI